MQSEWWVDQKQLDEDQIKVMNLPLEGDYLVLGPPGSGKTNLLLLRANYVSMSGTPNILIVVFGRALREFIVRGSAKYKFAESKVTTSQSCFVDLLKFYGAETPASDLPFESIRNELVERVKALLARLSEPPFDAIFLDEGQDFTLDEIEVFCSLGKRIFVVADTRQKLYNLVPSGLEHLRRKCQTETLRYHHRNGLWVCRVADSLGESMPDYQPMVRTSQYPEVDFPSNVRYHQCDFQSQISEISKLLEIQARAYPGELLGVICPRREDVQKMYSALRLASPTLDIAADWADYNSFMLSGSARVFVTTIHSSKGLEFRTVHAAMLDSLKKFPLQRNLVYTLATRAKTALDLYGNPLPPFLESALLRVLPTVKSPTIEDIFGRSNE